MVNVIEREVGKYYYEEFDKNEDSYAIIYAYSEHRDYYVHSDFLDQLDESGATEDVHLRRLATREEAEFLQKLMKEDDADGIEFEPYKTNEIIEVW